jgi:hypothetical protein
VTITGTVPGVGQVELPISSSFADIGATYYEIRYRFDSTYFEDRTPLTLTLAFEDKNHHQDGCSTTALVKNSAYVAANQTFEIADRELATVSGQAKAMNHSVNSTNDKGDDAAAIKGALPLYTVCFILTHGNMSAFADCICSTCSPPDCPSDAILCGPVDKVLFSDVATAVGRKSSGQPPYNFVMLNACENAGETDKDITHNFSAAFSVDGKVDQGMLAWHNFIQGSIQNADWTDRYWKRLAQGDTIMAAYLTSDLDGDFVGEHKRDDGSTWGPIVPVIYGDPKTKVHGVYGLKGVDWLNVIYEDSY